jgi:Tfp pilus assembly protein PilF
LLIYRQTARETEGEKILRNAIGIAPSDGGLHHALGLTLVRLKRPEEALAWAWAGGDRISEGRPDTVFRRPRYILLAIIKFSGDAGDTATALQYAEQLLRNAPDDQAVARLVDELRRQIFPR